MANLKSQSASRHHASYVPMMSLEERDRRWRMIRERMFVEGLDCLVLVGNDAFMDMGMANVRYVTQIGSKFGAFVVFPLVGEPVVWAGLPHMHKPVCRYLYTQNWVSDIRPKEGPEPVVKYLKEHGYERGKIALMGVVSKLMYGDIIPANVYNYIHKELPDANIVDATGWMEYFRIIKSPEEIGFLEKASEIARKTIDTLVQSAEPGKRECDVFADMVHTQIANGAEFPNFILLTSGPAEGPGEDKHLLHGDEQPAVPTTRTLEKGDVLMMEFHASYGGYLAAAELSLFLGKAPRELKRIHDVAVECAQAVKAAMKPGATLFEITKAQQEPCYRAGMDFLELWFHQHGLVSPGSLTLGLKHGQPQEHAIIGLDILKRPETQYAGSEIPVRENMVFGTNIDIFDPRWKKDVGIMLGDTLHVTKDGSRCLVNTPLDIFEKPG